MAKTNLSGSVAKIVDILTPLTSEERVRVTKASLTLLGEAVSGKELTENEGESDGAQSLNARAKSWVKQHGISLDELQQVFHVANGSMSVIAADIPGKKKKQQTLNAYVLLGISKLLSTGNPTFDDKEARELCESSGCYDKTNHATHLKGKGSLFTGGKDKGWTLTNPGLKHGVSLIKELSKKAG